MKLGDKSRFPDGDRVPLSDIRVGDRVWVWATDSYRLEEVESIWMERAGGGDGWRLVTTHQEFMHARDGLVVEAARSRHDSTNRTTP